jgi:ATPase subunit of ABC transporter with duplicated ATPase domains
MQKQLAVFDLTIFSYHRQLKALCGGKVTCLLLSKAFFSHEDFLLLVESTHYH